MSKPAAHLQLSADLLSELGGISLLTAHFKQAPTTEACRNLLAVMLDYVSLRLVQVSISSSVAASLCNHCSAWNMFAKCVMPWCTKLAHHCGLESISAVQAY